MVETGSFADLLGRWRRHRQFSQLDLATAAHTTQRHLSFLESGRSAPGPDMVLRLGSALNLGLARQNGLLAAAGYAAKFSQTPIDNPDLAAVRSSLRLILTGHEPMPAVVTQRAGVAVAANTAMALLLEDVAPGLLRPPVNVFRLGLHPDGLARRIVNFSAWAVHVVRAVESRAGNGNDPALDELARELRAYLPDDAAPDLLAGTIAPMVLRTRHGDAQLITTRMRFGNTVHTALDELELEAFLPADQATMRILREHAADPLSPAVKAALNSLQDNSFRDAPETG